VACLICLNTFVLVLECDHPVWKLPLGGHHYVSVWFVTNAMFLMCFLAELALRIAAFGCAGFFLDRKEWAWNLFDFFIVACGVLDAVEFLFIGHSHGGIFLVLRGLRLLRVLRVVRIFRSFKKLRALIRGLVESFQSVLWIALFLGVVIFISAIFTTEVLGKRADDWPEDERPDVEMYWGSVQGSALTLFQFLTLDDWKDVYVQVVAVKPWMRLFFVPYIMFAAFVMMSALTGVMAEHMDQVRTDEEEEEKVQRLEDFEAAMEALEEAFNEEAADVEGEALVSREAFPNLLASGPVAAELEAVGMEVSEKEASDLFEFFDSSGEGLISWEEFLQAMDDIHRGLTAKQVLKLAHAFRQATRQETAKAAGPPGATASTPDRDHWSKEAQRRLQEAEGRSERLDTSLDALEAQVHRLMEKFEGMRQRPHRRAVGPCGC